MNDDFKNNNRIDRLKRGLYSRKTPDIIDTPRSEFKTDTEPNLDSSPNAPENKLNDEENSKFDELAARIAHGAEKRHSFAKKLLTISTVLFVISIGVVGFVYLGGGNLISSKNVDIQIVGPLSVDGGRILTFDIEVINQNNTNLQGVTLKIEYPSGLRAISDVNKELTSGSFNLGEIKSGERSRQKIESFIFGKKEEVKDFKITVEYRIKNSSALFYKEKTHQVTIDSAPVIVNATYSKEVNSNQEIVFNVEAASNSSETIGDFLLNVEYPFGFSFKNASPAPAFGNNTWKIFLKSGEKQNVSIRGIIAGQDNEERIFKVNVGTESSDDERKIGVLFMSSNESILVKKPFIGVNLVLDGAIGDYVLKGSGGVNANLEITNNTLETVFNGVVEATFSGAAFSKNGVLPSSGGFFRSIDNTILWDKRAIEGLDEIEPGEGLIMNFRFTPLSYQSMPSGALPEIKLKVKVTGERILSSGAVENIESVEERTIKLATNLTLAPKIVRSQGNIENSGPIPPQADKETTYTVVWPLSNTFNTANNVEVKATLPSYVKWTNIKNPTTEDIIFNPDTHEVIWRLNQIVAGAGYKSAAKEAQFQISFLPSVSQIGQAPELVGPVSIRGIDKATGVTISSSAPALTSFFSADPTYKYGDEKVAP